MKRWKGTLGHICLLLILLLGCAPAPFVQAEEAAALPEVAFREVKIKGDDFIVVQATADVELSDYLLGYSSSEGLDKLKPQYQLAAASLRAGQAAVLVSGDSVPTCDAVYTMELPMELAETKGTVGLWKQERPAGYDITYTYIDSFTWTNSKNGTADIVRPVAAEEGLPTTGAEQPYLPTWFRRLDLWSLAWQIGNLTLEDSGTCRLLVKAGDPAAYPGLAETQPPAVVEDEEETDIDTPETTGGALAANTGLLAPQITELLPNPAGTGTDATDEFIELYNPNAEAFDLSGYMLRVGLTTTHSYTFPAGNVLAGQSFVVYYASETGLAMSNSGGQAALLDPTGTELTATDPYGTAGDGKAWALAEGVWYWTVSPTPAVANIISAQTAVKATAVTAKTAVKSATTKKATTKKTTAKTAAAKTTKAKTTKTAVTTTASASPERVTRGIHPLVLALVALAAVGYGLYEYRHDLANAVHQYRANRASRRNHRR